MNLMSKYRDVAALFCQRVVEWALPGVVLEEFDEMDFDGDYADKWFPFGRGVPIVLNPRIAGGGLTFDDTGNGKYDSWSV